ncbi:hypothetical protein PF008_g11678 [Phytophthora fragariae]|uniref:RxLR effector protein n=1 Tax=Phytophthora fragariae TaxID=53985 RepID=A0A6G0RQ66_9STRA|nr:hypothetical protein PF008_g11678 [Phytophthora fragariae]
MRLHYVFLAITATLVAVTDATFTSSALEQASEAKLVLPDTAQTMSTRSLKIRETKQESKHEERSGNLNLLTFLPQFLKEMEGKTNADILHRLNFTSSLRTSSVMLFSNYYTPTSRRLQRQPPTTRTVKYTLFVSIAS